MTIKLPESLLAHYRKKAEEDLTFNIEYVYSFLYVYGESYEVEMVYETASGLLWDANPDLNNFYYTHDVSPVANALTVAGLNGWKVPTIEQLIRFSRNTENPLRAGGNNRLFERCHWITTTTCINLDNFNTNNSSNGWLIACHTLFQGKTPLEVIQEIKKRGWGLCDLEYDPLTYYLTETPSLVEAYSEIDYLSARLPRLEPAQFTDTQKGLWEFWGMDAAELQAHGVRARNPALDVRDWNVAIDFGTSSTVVAYDEHDQHKLLRIGVSDYWAAEQPEDYENPTILEFIDFEALLKVWQAESYRPGVSWDAVRCSHAALQNFRDNKSNARAVGSMLAKIKHWALREANAPRLRLTDRSEPLGVEHELAPLTLRNPVRGQAMSVSSSDPFDPIELYAWFLGLTINWRGRGLFLRYYMTFPVDYPRDVKEKILASFRRGLQRSLPEPLISQPIFQNFSVEERASEPAAYAASAVCRLGIEATAEGEAYAVFDFGGGTTDFDFGYYRQPTSEEEDEGKEEVFEHFGAAGDKFLGGENLLENLAYLVFRHNLGVCREHRIAFTRPLDAADFAGSEMFLDKTQAASTNTVMLMARLRSYWESGALESSSGIESLDLLNNEGDRVACQLEIPEDALDEYLENRIEQGVRNFLAALQKAFAPNIPDTINVLLAGNSSRSKWVKEAFNTFTEADEASPMQARLRAYCDALFKQNAPTLVIHDPLSPDLEDPYAPTAKTGVALGLLRLCPGSPVLVINRAQEHSDGEAPFAHYVGRLRQGRFQVGITQGSEYGVWHELGVPSEGVFNLYHTQSPRAHTGDMKQGEPELLKHRLDLFGNLKGKRVFARITGPASIELCTASSIEDIELGACENTTPFSLL